MPQWLRIAHSNSFKQLLSLQLHHKTQHGDGGMGHSRHQSLETIQEFSRIIAVRELTCLIISGNHANKNEATREASTLCRMLWHKSTHSNQRHTTLPNRRHKSTEAKHSLVINNTNITDTKCLLTRNNSIIAFLHM